jgi:hypothetical protein
MALTDTFIRQESGAVPKLATSTAMAAGCIF